jgi:pseudaminic acid biosynthesis-associated methylase
MTEGEDPKSLWEGEFGVEWTERNQATVAEENEWYESHFGVSRTDLMERFLGGLDEDFKILEVGSNVGTQLKCLQEIGFSNLYGIDVQREAVERAHRERPELDIIEGDAFDIPFKDGFFDLVFTQGVLIRVPPEDLGTVMDEIVRCSSRWIYGHEYYADEHTKVEYRGHDDFLWKADFPELYQDGRKLVLEDETHLEYPSSDNRDVEYLLRKPE